MSFKSRIEEIATQQAMVSHLDVTKKAAFIAGAKFAIELLSGQLAVDPREPESVTKYLDKLRLQDVRRAIYYLLEKQE